MQFLNKWKVSALVLTLCLGLSTSTAAQAAEDPAAASESRYYKEIESNSWENWPAGPQIYAESAIVMEGATGTILYAKGIDEQHYPASITKIMTVLLALENLDMEEEITFSHNAVYSIDYASSHIARDEGEVLTVEECLYAIMLESANECSNAIAEHIAGSTEAFAELMNQRAAELGCTNTHFVNPHGLPDENHYTSAHDMALITREAIRHEKFRQISSTARYTLRSTNLKEEELLMNNHHYMISSYKTSKFLDDTVFAGKTGYTTAALNTLVTCATRGGMDLVVVTMRTQGSGEKGVPLYTDTANLLNYASENFHRVNISQNETNFTMGQDPLFDMENPLFGNAVPMIEMDTDGYVILPVHAEFSDASPQLHFTEDGESDVIATLEYTYAGQPIGSADLLLADSELQEFQFQKTDAEEGDPEAGQKEEKEPVHLIKVDMKLVGMIGLIILAVLAAVLAAKRIAKEYHMNFGFIKRWRSRRVDWNSFSNTRRRRYTSWKRRFRNRRRRRRR